MKYLLFILICININHVFAEKNLTAKSAIVISASTGKIIYKKNIYEKLLPASTVKLVTALIVSEQCSVAAKFKVSKYASSMPASKAYLKLGSYYTVSHLLHAVLLSSSNDAAVVLAEGVSGTEGNFVKVMNQKCRQIGAYNTKFANASGLPSFQEQYTTVYDLAIIMSAVIADPILTAILKRKSKTIISSCGKKKKIVNHNKLLKRDDMLLIGKTGYTKKAGQCFVGYKSDDKSDVIFAMLGGRKLWKEILLLLCL